MPLQILPQEGSFAQTLGSVLGTGLGGGLQALAEHKVNQMRDAAFQKTYGKGASDLLRVLSPEERKLALQNPEALLELSQLMGGQQQPLQPSGLQALQGLQQQESPGSILEQLSQPRQLQQGEDILKRLFTSPQQRMMEERLNLEQQRNELAQEKFKEQKLSNAYKATEKSREQTYKEFKSTKDDLKRLDEMERLTKEGKLTDPKIAGLLHAAGVENLGALFLKPDDEAYLKLQGDFIRNAKDLFGARVTDNELKSFLKTIPALWNSKEGRLQIINNMRKFAKAKLDRYNIEREIIRKNKGVPPLDLRYQVEDQLEDRLDKSAQEFKSGLNDLVKETSPQASAEQPQIFEDKPPAQSYKGRIIVDDNGVTYRSNGTDWIEEK